VQKLLKGTTVHIFTPEKKAVLNVRYRVDAEKKVSAEEQKGCQDENVDFRAE
jgi:hypothetical protein